MSSGACGAVSKCIGLSSAAPLLTCLSRCDAQRRCPSLQTNKKALLDELIGAGARVATIDDKSPTKLAKELAGMVNVLAPAICVC